MIARNGPAVDGRSPVGGREAAVMAQLQALAPHLDGEPDPAFRAATRARLVAMAAVRSPEPEPVPALRRLMAVRATDAAPARWRTRLTAGLAGAALTVTGLSTLVALSTDARPGDVLYGLKRGTEQTQLALAGDSRGQTLLDQASTRLEELEYLVSDEATALPAGAAVPAGNGPLLLAAGPDTELVLQTLGTMDAQTTDGAAWLADRAVTDHDADPLDDLAGWVGTQSAGLAALEADVPEAARAAFDESQQLLAEIATRSSGLRAALDCPSGPATDGADELGPLPAPCAPAPAEGGDPTTTPGTGSGTPPEGGAPTQDGGTPDRGAPRTDSPGAGAGEGAPGDDGPSVTVPGEAPTPGAPVPSLPVPSLDPPPPTAPGLPSLPGSTTSRPTPSLDVELDVCVGPIRIGAC